MLFSLEPVKCKDPGVPEFGQREGTNFIMGSEVIFSCKEGYELIGSSQLTCTEEGFWKQDVPYCKGKPSFDMFVNDLFKIKTFVVIFRNAHTIKLFSVLSH